MFVPVLKWDACMYIYVQTVTHLSYMYRMTCIQPGFREKEYMLPQKGNNPVDLFLLERNKRKYNFELSSDVIYNLVQITRLVRCGQSQQFTLTVCDPQLKSQIRMYM